MRTKIIPYIIIGLLIGSLFTVGLSVSAQSGFWKLISGGLRPVSSYMDVHITDELRFYDSDCSNYVGFEATGTVPHNIIFILPDATGTAGQVLHTDGNRYWYFDTDDTGGGGGSGQFTTTTWGIYYNSGDVVMGDDTTSSAPFWFDYVNDILTLNELIIEGDLETIGTTSLNTTSIWALTIGNSLTVPAGWTGLLWSTAGVVSATSDDDIPDAGDFGAATDLDADGALNADSVQDNEIDYTAVTLSDFTDDIENATGGTLAGYLLNTGDTASGEYNFGSNDLFISDDDDMVVVGSDATGTIIAAKFTMVSETPNLSDFGNVLYTGGVSGYPAYFLAAASGTEASPVIVSNDQYLGAIKFLGYDGTDFNHTGAWIYAIATGTPAENNIDADLYLQAKDGDVFISGSNLRPVGTQSLGIAGNYWDALFVNDITLPVTWTGLLRTDSGVMSTTTDDDVPEVGDFDAFVGGDYCYYDTSANKLNIDPEIATSSVTIMSEATTSYNGQYQHSFPYAVTITKIKASTNAVGTTTFQLDERAEDTPNSAGTDIMTSALAAGSIASTTAFDNAGIAAGNWISLDVDSTDSVNATSMVRINITYYIDD